VISNSLVLVDSLTAHHSVAKMLNYHTAEGEMLMLTHRVEDAEINLKT
jgi:hypothetical protein